MKPEKKVVSLETAKRLKAAGFPQDTERMYLMIPCRCPDHENWELLDSVTTALRRHDMRVKDEDRLPAPDAQELLARIHRPLRIELSADCGIRVLIHESEGIPEGELFYSDGDENLVDVLSSVWLWLDENKLIE